MAKSSKQRRLKDLRLFVAVYPPEAVAEQLLAGLAEFDLPPHRLVDPAQVHLTLQFIGNTPPNKLDEVTESIARSVKGLEPFDLQLTQLITLPQHGRARLIAAEADQPPDMMEIQRRLAQRMSNNPRRKPGDRFLPHFTIARFRSPSRFTLDETRTALAFAPFHVDRIALMKSTLSRRGAHHKPVETVEIGSH